MSLSYDGFIEPKIFSNYETETYDSVNDVNSIEAAINLARGPQSVEYGELFHRHLFLVYMYLHIMLSTCSGAMRMKFFSQALGAPYFPKHPVTRINSSR